MPRDAIDPEIFNQVVKALDPEGEVQALGAAGKSLALFLPTWGPAVRAREAATGIDDLLELAARSSQVFAPRGWGVTRFSTEVLRCALRESESDMERADQVLAEAWSESKIDQSVRDMKYVYARLENPQELDLRAGRWKLVRAAKDLHLAGNYAASVPMMLASIEGFVADANHGKLFFTRHPKRRTVVEDPARLVGIVSALKTLHTVYTEGVGETTTGSRLSRHGIMHGRVLGYGTKVVSAQVFTLFDAVADYLNVPG